MKQTIFVREFSGGDDDCRRVSYGVSSDRNAPRHLFEVVVWDALPGERGEAEVVAKYPEHEIVWL